MTTSRPRRALVTLLIVAAAGAAWPPSARAQTAANGQATRLRFVASVSRLDLESVTNAIVSRDGKYVYCTAWQALSNVVFTRDPKTGALTHLQTIANPDYLDGTTGLTISSDQRRAAATAFSSKTAVLYDRDPETGRLDVADIAQEGADGVSGLAFPIDVAFSPDGRFVYVVDDRGSGGKGEG